MKNYLVLVECEDYINVDAESEEEAIRMAEAEANSSLNHDWKATVMSGGEPEESNDDEIPY